MKSSLMYLVKSYFAMASDIVIIPTILPLSEKVYKPINLYCIFNLEITSSMHKCILLFNNRITGNNCSPSILTIQKMQIK